MKKKITIIQLLIITLFLTFNVRQVYANGNLAISVKAILPENQHDKDVTYFDLRMKPKQEQEVFLELTNPTKDTQKLKLEINDGTTNDNGVIDYSKRDSTYKRDDSLKISVTDVAKIQDSVTIKPESKELVKIKISMPETPFKGVLFGGILVSDFEDKEKPDTKKASGMQIKNKVSYTIGLKLSESDDEVKANLDLIKAYADQADGHNVVKVKIQNNMPQKLDDIVYKAEVTEQGKKEVLHQANNQGYRFAPNSNFDYRISWENQPFKSGRYTVHMTAESKKTGQKWEWDKDFNITSTEARELNAKAVDLDKDNRLLYIIIAILIVLLLSILIIVLLKIRNKKEEKRRKELKKKKKNSLKKKSNSKNNKNEVKNSNGKRRGKMD